MRQDDRDKLLVAVAEGLAVLLFESKSPAAATTFAQLEAALEQAERSNERLTDAGMDPLDLPMPSGDSLKDSSDRAGRYA